MSAAWWIAFVLGLVVAFSVPLTAKRSDRASTERAAVRWAWVTVVCVVLGPVLLLACAAAAML